jgi:transporter family-2 protein
VSSSPTTIRAAVRDGGEGHLGGAGRDLSKGYKMWFLYVFAAVAGMLNAFQSGANATLSKTLEQPFLAAVIVLAVSAASFIVIGAVSGHLGLPTTDKWTRLPWWAWVGGMLGASVLASQLFVAREIGAGPFMGITVTAAVTVSLALDHFGLMGFEVHAAGLWRIVGAILMIAGVGLIAWF